MLKNKKIRYFSSIISLTLLTFLFFIVFTGCKKETGLSSFKIGAIIPLTGPSSTLGELHKFGMEIAVEEINKSALLNKKIEIVYEDSRNEAKTGISAFNKLTLQKTQAVIATFSNVCVPLASYVATKKANDLPVLLVTAVSAPKITELSPMVFRAFITSDVESKEIAKFIINKNYKAVAIYYVDDDYGKGAERVFRENFAGEQRKIVFSDGFRIGQTDHKSTITKIISSSPEIIFVVGYERDFALAIKQMREMGFKSDIITTAPLAIPQNMALAGNTEGIYLTASRFETEETKIESTKFKEAFINKFHVDTNYQSASTYLCVKLIAEALRTNGYSSNSIREGLLKIRGFSSPLGSINIDLNREGSFPVVVKQIRAGKINDLSIQ